LGIVSLVLGVAFFLAYQLKTLGPAGKVLVGMLTSGVILGAGTWFDRKERYRILARAQFAQANFSAAAATYRKLLEIDSANPEMVAAYAQTLAASDRRNALVEFRRWAESSNGHRPKDVEVAEAGLALLSGNPEAARRLQAEFTQGDADQAAEFAGELG
jgi:hypothetical protein